jgi:hypothetical protein
MSEPKELGYFATDRIFNDDHDFSTEGKYLSVFKSATETIMGESNDIYLASSKACKNIGSKFPDAKIIFTLRYPVGFINSRYHDNKLGYPDIKSLREELTIEKERVSHLFPYPINAQDERQCYFHLVKFNYSGVEKYIEKFDKDQVLILLQTDLLQNTIKTYKNVLDFLEINPTDFSHHHTSRKRRFQSLEKLRRLFHKSLPSLLTLTRKILPTSFKTYLSDFDFKKVTKEPIDLALQTEIKEYFREDVL